jgi:putative salt-induced outer membrane protein YdiY
VAHSSKLRGANRDAQGGFAGMMTGSVDVSGRLKMMTVCDGAKHLRHLVLFVFAVVLAWGPASAVHATESPLDAWSGDVDGLYEFNKSEYTSSRLTLSIDVSYPMAGRALDGELRFDREYVKEQDNSTSIDKDKYDASLKYKEYLDDSSYYLYASPRMRHNRNGFYHSAQAVRTGLGRKLGGEGDWVVNLELGSGYRVAHTDQGEDISEVLYTVTVKATWAINERISLKFNGVQEQSRRETFRTMSLALRDKLTNKFGLKYEVFYRRSYPFDAFEKDGELSAEVGISYSF